LLSFSILIENPLSSKEPIVISVFIRLLSRYDLFSLILSLIPLFKSDLSVLGFLFTFVEVTSEVLLLRLMLV